MMKMIIPEEEELELRETRSLMKVCRGSAGHLHRYGCYNVSG